MTQLKQPCYRTWAAALCGAVILGLAGPAKPSLAQDSPVGDPAPAVFSGPQVGEALPPFTVRGVLGAIEGKPVEPGQELDFVAKADGGPIVLVFVHELSRPAIGMVRQLTQFSEKREKDGLTTGVVWLDDDPAEAERILIRARRALNHGTPAGVSLDGAEGPGAYGLNRNVALTILVGNEGKVTANFALVQPSARTNLPLIFDALVALVGGDAPEIEDPTARRRMTPQVMIGRNGAMPEGGRDNAAEPDPRLRSLLGPVIRKNATDDEVDRAAAAVEKYAAENEAVREEIGRIAKRIVGSDRLTNYGTPRSQQHIRDWAKKYGPAPGPEAASPDPAPASTSTEGDQPER